VKRAAAVRRSALPQTRVEASWCSGGLADAALPEHRLGGLDDATAAALLDTAAPGLPLTTRSRVLHEAAGNPLALLELPGAGRPAADEQSLPGGLPLTDRLERAFAGHVSDLPDTTRLALLVAALSDGDAVGEILQAASAVTGSSVDRPAACAAPSVRACAVAELVGARQTLNRLPGSAVREVQ
jgi:hypothetical protein